MAKQIEIVNPYRPHSKMSKLFRLLSKRGGATLTAAAKEIGWTERSVYTAMHDIARKSGAELTRTNTRYQIGG